MFRNILLDVNEYIVFLHQRKPAPCKSQSNLNLQYFLYKDCQNKMNIMYTLLVLLIKLNETVPSIERFSVLFIKQTYKNKTRAKSLVDKTNEE